MSSEIMSKKERCNKIPVSGTHHCNAVFLTFYYLIISVVIL